VEVASWHGGKFSEPARARDAKRAEPLAQVGQPSTAIETHVIYYVRVDGDPVSYLDANDARTDLHDCSCVLVPKNDRSLHVVLAAKDRPVRATDAAESHPYDRLELTTAWVLDFFDPYCPRPLEHCS